MKNTKKETLARELADKAAKLFPIGLAGCSARDTNCAPLTEPACKIKAVKPRDRLNPSRAIKP